MENYLDLSGKAALITGASSGIGAATAITFAKLGAKVAIAYNKNQKGIEEVQCAVKAVGGNAILFKLTFDKVMKFARWSLAPQINSAQSIFS